MAGTTDDQAATAGRKGTEAGGLGMTWMVLAPAYLILAVALALRCGEQAHVEQVLF
jgi:hypothetical protein